MYLSLATHDARVAAPVGTGGASALARGSHLNSYRYAELTVYLKAELHTEGKASAARLKLLPSWIVCI